MCRWKLLDLDGGKIIMGGVNKEAEEDRKAWTEGCRKKK